MKALIHSPSYWECCLLKTRAEFISRNYSQPMGTGSAKIILLGSIIPNDGLIQDYKCLALFSQFKTTMKGQFSPGLTELAEALLPLHFNATFPSTHLCSLHSLTGVIPEGTPQQTSCSQISVSETVKVSFFEANLTYSTRINFSWIKASNVKFKKKN